MTGISKAEKLARALDNFRSGGRSFDRQLAAQISKELRAQAARIAEFEAQERKSRGYRVGHIAGYHAALRDAANISDGYGPCACDPDMRDAILVLINKEPKP